MDSEKNDRQWLKKLFQGKGDGKKKKLSIQYVIMIACAGIGMMIIGNVLADGQEQSLPVLKEESSSQEAEPAFGQSESAEPYSMKDYEMRYENELKETLEHIIGVSDVSVMVNLAETERNVYEKNTSLKQQQTDETDREGGTRKVDDLTRDEQLVIIRNGNNEEPILIKKEKPVIRGVLVVAEGADNIKVKSMIVEAVSRVLDVPAHRISVLPKKSKGE